MSAALGYPPGWHLLLALSGGFWGSFVEVNTLTAPLVFMSPFWLWRSTCFGWFCVAGLNFTPNVIMAGTIRDLVSIGHRRGLETHANTSPVGHAVVLQRHRGDFDADHILVAWRDGLARGACHRDRNRRSLSFKKPGVGLGAADGSGRIYRYVGDPGANGPWVATAGGFAVLAVLPVLVEILSWKIVSPVS